MKITNSFLKSYIIIPILLTWNCINAQRFSFKMVFVNALGDRDSITLGNDSQGTYLLDTALGESNILQTPLNNKLDVRAGNVWYQRLPNPERAPVFQSKKQIVKGKCDTGTVFFQHLPIEINIVSNHFPLTAYWDKNIFKDTCYNGSIFTEVERANCCDLAGFKLRMVQTDSLVFDKNLVSYTKDGEKVYVYWVVLYDSTLLITPVRDARILHHQLKVFPNPTLSDLNLDSNENFGTIRFIEIYNTFGQVVMRPSTAKKIDISNLNTGLYYVRVKNKLGWAVTKKIFKL